MQRVVCGVVVSSRCFAVTRTIWLQTRYLMLFGGAICLGIGYNLCVLFLSIKIPGYLSD